MPIRKRVEHNVFRRRIRGNGQGTHLVGADAYVVTVIDMSINVERPDGTKDDLRRGMPVEGTSREMDREIRISCVLIRMIR